jgi:hypothetical protein
MGICRRLGKNDSLHDQLISHIRFAGQIRQVHQDMIRERVSTQGIIRPLEPEPELPAMQLPPELVGTPLRARDTALRHGATHACEEVRARDPTHREAPSAQHRPRDRDMDQHIAALQHYLDREKTGAPDASWTLAWALDADERPPPSSIVARRDTAEALKLARVADKAVLESERTLSANNLWSVCRWLPHGVTGRAPQEAERRRELGRTSLAPGRRGLDRFLGGRVGRRAARVVALWVR